MRSPLATLFAIVFSDLVGFGIVIPLLPLVAEHHTASPWQLGVLMASFSAMQFLFSPLLGRLSDRVGRRPVLLISLAGSVAGYGLFAFAHSFAALLLSRVVAGIAGANIATAQAVIADLTPPEGRARGMGLIGAAFGLGFIAGPAIAALLMPLGAAAPGLGAAACSLVALAMAAALLPESLPEDRRGRSARRWALPLAQARERRELWPLYGIGFVLVLGFAAFEVTFAQFLHGRVELPNRSVSLLFVYLGVLAAVVQGGIVGRLSRRFAEHRLLIAGLVLAAAGLAAIAPQHRLGPVMLVMPLVALGLGLVNPSLSSLVSRRAAAHAQGEVLGAYQGVASLARVVGPLAGELAYGAVGAGAPAVGAAVLMALGALAVLLLVGPS